jgi:hypothetical protein
MDCALEFLRNDRLIQSCDEEDEVEGCHDGKCTDLCAGIDIALIQMYCLDSVRLMSISENRVDGGDWSWQFAALNDGGSNAVNTCRGDSSIGNCHPVLGRVYWSVECRSRVCVCVW